MTRCLILGCSKSKREEPQTLPALERYDGPTFLVVRKFLAETPPEAHDVEIYMLSAKYGLISADEKIANYDQKMTKPRASSLQPEVLTRLQGIFVRDFNEIFISLSQLYLQALDGFKSFVPDGTKVIISQASMGRRLTELKRWLYRLPEGAIASEREESTVHTTGQATLRGQEIEATAEEVMALARQALEDERGKPYNFRSWYALVDGEKVNTKWLASLLSGLEVSEFQSSEARRVLKQLGVEVYHDD
jgi:hypothetical protein